MEHAFQRGVTDRYYSGMEELLSDVFAQVEEEVAAATASGVQYIQIDNPNYANLMAIEKREEMRTAGKDPDVILQNELDNDNKLLRRAKRSDNLTGVHICLGTYIGAPKRVTGTRVNYDADVLARILESLEADAFTCEFSPRSGTMECLASKPKLGNKIVALGIVNVLDPTVEEIGFVIKQVEKAARYVDLANLAVCNNCGFSGASADAYITADIQQRKLKVLAASAESLWGSA